MEPDEMLRGNKIWLWNWHLRSVWLCSWQHASLPVHTLTACCTTCLFWLDGSSCCSVTSPPLCLDGCHCLCMTPKFCTKVEQPSGCFCRITKQPVATINASKICLLSTFEKVAMTGHRLRWCWPLVSLSEVDTQDICHQCEGRGPEWKHFPPIIKVKASNIKVRLLCPSTHLSLTGNKRP